MKNINIGQWIFYSAFAVGIYLYLNPSKTNNQYYKYVVIAVAAWVVWSSFWNILVASKIIVANKRMQRKIERAGSRGLHMTLALLWLLVGLYIIYVTVTGRPLLFFLN